MAFQDITTNAVNVLQVFISWSALGALLFISLLLTLISTLFYKYLTDQKLIKQTKDEMKILQNEIKTLKDSPDKMMEKQKDIMQKNLILMKGAFKPSLYTMIPFLVIFLWIRTAFTPLGKIAFGLTWIWIYIISSIVFSMLLRKLLKVY